MIPCGARRDAHSACKLVRAQQEQQRLRAASCPIPQLLAQRTRLCSSLPPAAAVRGQFLRITYQRCGTTTAWPPVSGVFGGERHEGIGSFVINSRLRNMSVPLHLPRQEFTASLGGGSTSTSMLSTGFAELHVATSHVTTSRVSPCGRRRSAATPSSCESICRSALLQAAPRSDMAAVVRAGTLTELSGRLTSHRRLRRLLPDDIHRANLSASYPSLAYSSYRALDVFRGGTGMNAASNQPADNILLDAAVSHGKPIASAVSGMDRPDPGGPRLTVSHTAPTRLTHRVANDALAPPPHHHRPNDRRDSKPCSTLACSHTPSFDIPADTFTPGRHTARQHPEDGAKNGMSAITPEAAATRVQSVARKVCTTRAARSDALRDSGVELEEEEEEEEDLRLGSAPRRRTTSSNG